MAFRSITPALLVTLIAACSGPTEEAPSPPVAELSGREVLALESTPGSTPALVDAVEPAAAVVADLDGAPGASPAFGPIDAPVRVYVLTDFQCPVCRRIVEPIKYLARRHPTDVRIVLKHNALASHGRAAQVAAASMAAFRQGRFWEFYDKVFANAGRYDDDTLVGYAQALGLDEARFRKDLADEKIAAQVKYESELASAVELRSTPSFVINGTSQMGWGSYQGIEGMVTRELARAKTLGASGVAPNRVAYEATRQSGPKGEQLAAALFPAMK